MNESGLSKNRIIAELSKSAHGELKAYLPVGKEAAAKHGEFFAHLIAWDRIKGAIRDAKVALPVVSFTAKNYPEEFQENSLAAISLLGPREMLKAYRFVEEIKSDLAVGASRHSKGTGNAKGIMTRLTNVLCISLLERERNWPRWERTMLQHRAVLKELFSLLRLKPRDQRTNACLFRSDKVNGTRIRLPYPEGGLFEVVSRLKDMSPQEAAGTIMNKKIPFLIAMGALGEKAKDTDLVLALIQSMTATELTTNVAMLERLGVKTNPALRGAFQEAIEKAGKSKTNTFKATRAAENLDDEDLKEAMRGLQEKQIQQLGGVDGDWLVLGDKSGSMSRAIEAARLVAATLTKMVKGKVWLTFFNTQPQTIDVTGASLDIIKKGTAHIVAGGGTSIGCGLMRMLDGKTLIDGIAIVSDGGDNSVPYFHDAYKQYSDFAGKQVPVYLYQLEGDTPDLIRFMQGAGYDLQIFDLRGQGSDFYSLPNLVATMRTNRYSLIDEILDTKLLLLPDHFKHSTAKTASA